jgi:hypothetical protein
MIVHKMILVIYINTVKIVTATTTIAYTTQWKTNAHQSRTHQIPCTDTARDKQKDRIKNN